MLERGKYAIYVLVGFLATPLVTFAATNGVARLIGTVRNIIDALVPIVIGLAILFFLWGVFKYFFMKGEADKEGGRDFMMYGILALFVMVSVWGLVRMLQSAIIESPEVENRAILAPKAIPNQ